MKSLSGFAAMVFSVLILAAPAKADYTGSAVLDWSSLTFSGVAVDVSPKDQGLSASIFNSTLAPPEPIDGRLYGFPAGTIQVNSSVAPVYGEPIWSAQTASVTTQETGTSTASFDMHAITASTSLHGVGYSLSSGAVDGFLVAHTTGSLTLSIGYTVAHEFAPTGTGQWPDFFAHSDLRASIIGPNGEFATDHKTLVAPAGSSSQSGTLSVTQWLTAGVKSYFEVSTDLNVNNPNQLVRTVPIPDMLWSTVLGMIGVAWYVRRRQRAH